MGDERVTDRQWHKLLDIVSTDQGMLTGTFSGPNGKSRLAKKWQSNAALINNGGGASKSGDKWKESFNGLKRRARAAYSAQKIYLEGTGGGEDPEEVLLGLSEVYSRCLELVGVVGATGNAEVAHPLLVTLKAQKTSASNSKVNAAQPPQDVIGRAVSSALSGHQEEKSNTSSEGLVAKSASFKTVGNTPFCSASSQVLTQASSSTAALVSEDTSGGLFLPKSMPSLGEMSNAHKPLGPSKIMPFGTSHASSKVFSFNNVSGKVATPPLFSGTLPTSKHFAENSLLRPSPSDMQGFSFGTYRNQQPSRELSRDQKKVLHTPPHRIQESPARKKLSSRTSPSHALDGDTSASLNAASEMQHLSGGLGKLNVSHSNGNATYEEGVPSMQETLQLIQLSLVAIIDSLEDLKTKLGRNTQALEQLNKGHLKVNAEGILDLNAEVRNNTEVLRALTIDDMTVFIGDSLKELNDNIMKNTEALKNMTQV